MYDHFETLTHQINGEPIIDLPPTDLEDLGIEQVITASPETVQAISDLADSVSDVNGVSETSVASDIVDVVNDVTGDQPPSSVTELVSEIQDVQNTIDEAYSNLQDDDSSEEEKQDAKETITDSSEEKADLLSDLAQEAASVPGVDPLEISAVLTDAAEQANGGEVPDAVVQAEQNVEVEQEEDEENENEAASDDVIEAVGNLANTVSGTFFHYI
jgi:hypothetical protein